MSYLNLPTLQKRWGIDTPKGGDEMEIYTTPGRRDWAAGAFTPKVELYSDIDPEKINVEEAYLEQLGVGDLPLKFSSDLDVENLRIHGSYTEAFDILTGRVRSMAKEASEGSVETVFYKANLPRMPLESRSEVEISYISSEDAEEILSTIESDGKSSYDLRADVKGAENLGIPLSEKLVEKCALKV